MSMGFVGFVMKNNVKVSEFPITIALVIEDISEMYKAGK